MRSRDVLRFVTAALFIGAGTAHLIRPALFATIVPPHLGDPQFDVMLSGIAEIAGGAGLLPSRTRRYAAAGLVLLLIAVWPANIYMALEAQHFVALAPAWLLWLRVPLQLPLVVLVIVAGKTRKPLLNDADGELARMTHARIVDD